MRKVELPQELVSYMTSPVCGTFVFIDDFSGWNAEAENIPGVTFMSAMEGNGLKCNATGKTWIPQCCSIRRGNHLKAQFRSYNEKNQRSSLDREVILGELPLFKDFPVVIMTNNESLQAFVPVCSSKLELALFIAAIEAETEKRNAASENGYDYRWSLTAGNMISLAKFLYKSNPEKTKSPLDDLD